MTIVLSGRVAEGQQAYKDPAVGGQRIYKEQCARCHGKAGEGSEDYPRTLAGDKSVKQLAKLIAKTMPEDDPGTCTGDNADAVASYIYDAFYSKTAQERNRPARIELARLTVRQYRNAVADLIGSFREPGNWGDARGLGGEYFKTRRIGDGNQAIKRVDPEVRFDFKKDSPDLEKIKPKEYAARWQGSVFAPETGEYEFIVRTPNSTKLWVNDTKKPLIDAWVQSGKDTEHRGTIRLLGGRAYPIRLEFAKGKDGVKDKEDKKKAEEIEPASIALEWKQPGRVVETIPARDLAPVKMPETFVLETPFPPDDRSIGYERGTSVSKAWDTSTTDAAIEVADYVSARLRELSGASDGDTDREKKLREFAGKFAERAFRRPLTDDEKKVFVDKPFAKGLRPEEAVKRVVLLTLKSPRFLYREVGGRDAFAVASRISFGLWDSAPDQVLLEAAKSNQLATREQVAKQAERMLRDLRARAKLRDFFFQWLKVDQPPDLAKDAKLYPGFDLAVASDLRASLDLFLEDVAWGESSDFRRLLLDDSAYLNGRLARVYGADLPPDAPFKKVALEKERAGVITHPYLLSTFAYTASSSPIHRGVFLARSVLGKTLRPPPEAVAPLPADLHAGMTTRQRVAMQTNPAACQTCHSVVNPLGFTLEHFDAIGRFRSEELGKPVDPSGAYQPPEGGTVTFGGARDLATYLAASDEVHGAFVEKLFHQVVQQPIRAYGPDRLAELRHSFAKSGFRIRDLMVEIVASTALGPDAPEPAPALAQAIPQPPPQSPPASDRKRAIAPEDQVVPPDSEN
ncbi:MAG TPA: DUF1592 domain-containing protein [Isosphaeraceae bacterium]